MSIFQTYGTAIINNIGPAVLFYFAIRFMFGRFRWPEAIVRSVLGIAALVFAITASSVVGNQLINNFRATLLQNLVPVLLFFTATTLGIRHGAIRNSFAQVDRPLRLEREQTAERVVASSR